MSNGILSALKQQDGSIDELAKLPQAMIMQMAQRKEIGAEMVAPILARKAQMSDAIARTKAMQAGGGQQPSIMEQLMQKNAEAEQPEPQAREMGIAQLPIQEGMYDEQRMAAGGIVAFADGGMNDISFAEGSETDKRILDYLKSLPRSVVEKFKEYNKPYGTTFEGSPAELQSILSGKTPRKIPANIDSQYEEQGKNAYVSAPLKAEPSIRSLAPAAPTTTAKAPTTTAKAPTKEADTTTKAKPAEVAKAEAVVDPIDAMIAKYEKMIMGDPEARSKAMRDARNARMLEAGLGIMGGTSTNFAENIGRGATQAAKGYGEDVKGIRAEESAKLTQLAGLGLKGAQLKQEARKLGITEQHYKDWLKVQEKQIAETGATRRDAAQTRVDTAMEGRILNAAKMIAARPENMNLSDEELYAKATKLVTGKSAQPTFTGFSGRSLSSK